MLLRRKPHIQIRCCQSSSVIIKHAAARPAQPHTALRWPTVTPSDPMAAVPVQGAGGCIFCSQFIHSGLAEAEFFLPSSLPPIPVRWSSCSGLWFTLDGSKLTCVFCEWVPTWRSFGLQFVIIWGLNFLAAFIPSSSLLSKCSRANGVINTGNLSCYWPWPWERRVWGG